MDVTCVQNFLGFSGITLFMLLIVCSGIESALLCSQCTSGPTGQCVTSPPSATECPHSRDNDVNCVTTKKYTDNGTLLEFSRGCTMVRVGEGCVEQNNNITLCYVVCHMDNCNQSNTITVSYLNLVLIFGFILFQNQV